MIALILRDLTHQSKSGDQSTPRPRACACATCRQRGWGYLSCADAFAFVGLDSTRTFLRLLTILRLLDIIPPRRRPA